MGRASTAQGPGIAAGLSAAAKENKEAGPLRHLHFLLGR
jgi:hypothetical protein